MDTAGAGIPSVEALLALVHTIARTVGHGLPPVVELDDLVHDGVIGLLESARRFDPSRGVDFRTYATYRIRGAILDGLRSRDPLPRGIRRALRVTGEPGEPLPADGRLRARMASVPVTQLLSLEDAGPVAQDGGEPEERLVALELRRELNLAIRALPDRDRDVLRLRFARGWRLREVAAHYGVSITRIAELQDRAINRLRRALEVPSPSRYSPNGRLRRRSRTGRGAQAIGPRDPVNGPQGNGAAEAGDRPEDHRVR